MNILKQLILILVLTSCVGINIHADDTAIVKLPDIIITAWKARFSNNEIVVIKMKDGDFEIKAKGYKNQNFKVLYAADGRLISEEKHRIPIELVPSNVLKAARSWAHGTKWGETATIETKKGNDTVYELSGELYGETLKTHIRADGTQIHATELPTVKNPTDTNKSGPKFDHDNRVIRCC